MACRTRDAHRCEASTWQELLAVVSHLMVHGDRIVHYYAAAIRASTAGYARSRACSVAKRALRASYDHYTALLSDLKDYRVGRARSAIIPQPDGVGADIRTQVLKANVGIYSTNIGVGIMANGPRNIY